MVIYCSMNVSSENIVRAIAEVIDPSDQLLIIHSSLPKLLRGSDLSLRSLFVGAVRELLRQGKTLMFPCFTFSYPGSKYFNSFSTKGETGQLSNWLLDLPEFSRTPNPIFSFVVAGPLMDEIMECDHSDAYGEHSPLAKMEVLGGRVCMLGAEWDYCSFLHRLEQEQKVPYRVFKEFRGVVDFGEGPEESSLSVFVRDQEIPSELNFAVVRESTRAKGLIRQARLFEGVIESISVRDLAEDCRQNLRKDPYYLLKQPRKVEAFVKNRRARKVNREIRIAVLSDSEVRILVSKFEEMLKSLIPNRSFKLYNNGFGTMYEEIYDSRSDLYSFRPNYTFFVNRIEDLVGAVHLEFVDEELLNKAVERYCDAVKHYKVRSHSSLALCKFAPARSFFSRLSEGMNMTAASERMESEVLGGMNLAEDVILNVDASFAVDVAAESFDSRLWYLGRIPFGNQFNNNLAKLFFGVVAGFVGSTIRVIVTDLDNTLWGGNIGEDGLEGIKLGGDYPGNVFVDFQKALKLLSARGIILAVCSKNDEALAIEVMNSHAEMVLEADDFIEKKINWSRKSANILEIANNLGIGLEHILFVDDNPAERDEVRRALPEVRVLDLPDDPAYYLRTLLQYPLMNTADLSSEDSRRNHSYAMRSKIQNERLGYEQVEDFYKSLDVRVSVERVSTRSISRAAQLMAKTNQFNSSLRRYSALELGELESRKMSSWVIKVVDKYNEEEILGVLVFDSGQSFDQELVLDSVVLSCRGLGKGVESGLLKHLACLAQGLGYSSLKLEYQQTERNGVVGKVLSECGFIEAMGNYWVWKFAAGMMVPPDWVRVDLEEFSKHLSKTKGKGHEYKI